MAGQAGKYTQILLRYQSTGTHYSTKGIPMEFCFVPGCESDVQALKKLPLAVAAQSRIYGDAAYPDYTIEDDLKEADGIERG